MKLGAWKKIIIPVATVIIAVSLFLFLNNKPEAAKLDPKEALKKGLNAFKTLMVTGHQRITVYRDGKPLFSEEIKSPIEPFLMAQAQEPWNEKGRRKLDIYRRLKQISYDFKFGEGFLDQHDSVIKGMDKVAGRKVWEIEVHPAKFEGGYLKLYLDSETGYPLKRVKYDRKGMRENSVEFTHIEAITERPAGLGMGMLPPGPGEGRFDEPPPMGPPQGGDKPPGRRELFRPPEGPGPQGRPGPFRPEFGPGRQDFRPPAEALVPPETFIQEYISNGKALFPTYLPEGYDFVGGIKLPNLPEERTGRLHMIFTDGVNSLSIFQVHLPAGSMSSGEAREFLRRKAGEFLNSYPEGVGLRKVDDGLIVGMGDLPPEIIERVVGSMVLFEGDKPASTVADTP